jgi:hypothetical protein
MKLREHDFGGGDFFRRMEIDGNAAAVVDDRHAIVDVDFNLDLITEAGERLVDGIIHDFVNEVMQAPLTGVADVHSGALANRVEAFKDLNIIGTVMGWRCGFVRSHISA